MTDDEKRAVVWLTMILGGAAIWGWVIYTAIRQGFL